ncbi:hypothetical protein QBC38DRAFT_395552 [Podospora fimiseda]|uniref:Thiaminase-2/PQQC domain-containing protein n=1 Tax=Podospora fimiseda TaxID=252190 RepID=A0AAN7BLG6_9PEZI|nr:hypothetical protein QBC38DRAFT_395552 [Podospora fimiseda]
MAPQWSLTNHLLGTNSSLFTSATQHPFLLAAAHGTLPKDTLSRWLANDRLYIHSYIRAAGKLLESIELPIELATENYETRLVDWLIEALVAVRREERMFLDVAGRYGLSLGLGSSSEIKTMMGEKLPGLIIIEQSFRDIVPNVSARSVQGNAPRRLAWLEGAVTFWGTERCYLDAWSWAKANEPESKDVRDDEDGGALRKEFIPNWSSEGFREFVERLGRLIDEAVAGELEMIDGEEERENLKLETLQRVEAKWKTLLEGERAFWPEISNE